MKDKNTDWLCGIEKKTVPSNNNKTTQKGWREEVLQDAVLFSIFFYVVFVPRRACPSQDIFFQTDIDVIKNLGITKNTVYLFYCGAELYNHAGAFASLLE